MKRIVSMLPAATEIVWALGRVDWLVAVSHDCSYPPEVRRLPWATRCTFDAADMDSRSIDETVRQLMREGKPLFVVDREVLRRTKPDVIITQKLCDVCAVSPTEVQRALSEVALRAAVLELGPQSLEDVLGDVRRVAEAIGEPDRGQQLHDELTQRLERVRRQAAGQPRKRVVVLEWLDPPYCCGHWIPELVEIAGGEELLGVRNGDSHVIRWTDVQQADPDVLVVACCGYMKERALGDATRQEILAELRKLRAYHRGQVWLCEGSGLFTCPGPRVVDTAELLYTLLHHDGRSPLPDACLRLAPDQLAG